MKFPSNNDVDITRQAVTQRLSDIDAGLDSNSIFTILSGGQDSFRSSVYRGPLQKLSDVPRIDQQVIPLQALINLNASGIKLTMPNETVVAAAFGVKPPIKLLTKALQPDSTDPDSIDSAELHQYFQNFGHPPLAQMIFGYSHTQNTVVGGPGLPLMPKVLEQLASLVPNEGFKTLIVGELIQPGTTSFQQVSDLGEMNSGKYSLFQTGSLDLGSTQDILSKLGITSVIWALPTQPPSLDISVIWWVPEITNTQAKLFNPGYVVKVNPGLEQMVRSDASTPVQTVKFNIGNLLNNIFRELKYPLL